MSDLPAQEQPSTRTDADPAEAADHALPAPSNVAPFRRPSPASPTRGEPEPPRAA